MKILGRWLRGNGENKMEGSKTLRGQTNNRYNAHEEHPIHANRKIFKTLANTTGIKSLPALIILQRPSKPTSGGREGGGLLERYFSGSKDKRLLHQKKQMLIFVSWQCGLVKSLEMPFSNLRRNLDAVHVGADLPQVVLGVAAAQVAGTQDVLDPSQSIPKVRKW